MSEQHQQSNADRTRRWRHIGLAVAILLCAGLVACTAAEPPTSVTTTPTAEPTIPPLPDGELAAGTYRFDGFSVPMEVTVPEGWTWVQDAALRKDVGDTEGVFVWLGHASHVPADACQWPGTLAGIGPSVEEFADALEAQTSTTMTGTREVSVGAYNGVEFDFAVDGIAALADCSGAKICVHSESPECTRWYNSSVAQRETYRVLDLDGERVILTVGEFDDQSKESLTEEAQAVFDSITFNAD